VRSRIARQLDESGSGGAGGEPTFAGSAGVSSVTVTSSMEALDGVLRSIKGTKGINTVEKSAHDWDAFKQRTGDEDLAQRARNGYIERQEFLQRVDWRRYELERSSQQRRQQQQQQQQHQ
jgi:hypothetical protein